MNDPVALFRKTLACLLLVSVVIVTLALVALSIGPRLLGWDGVVVLSGSMEPALKVGAYVLIEPADDPYSIEVGDIIAYRRDSSSLQLISHRVIDLVPDGNGEPRFRTKGDANAEADRNLVTASQLAGRVRHHLPYVGYIAKRLRAKEFFFILVAAPGTLLIASEVARIRVLLKDERARRQPRPQASPPLLAHSGALTPGALATTRHDLTRSGAPTQASTHGVQLMMVVPALLLCHWLVELAWRSIKNNS